MLTTFQKCLCIYVYWNYVNPCTFQQHAEKCWQTSKRHCMTSSAPRSASPLATTFPKYDTYIYIYIYIYISTTRREMLTNIQAPLYITLSVSCSASPLAPISQKCDIYIHIHFSNMQRNDEQHSSAISHDVISASRRLTSRANISKMWCIYINIYISATLIEMLTNIKAPLHDVVSVSQRLTSRANISKIWYIYIHIYTHIHFNNTQRNVDKHSSTTA